MGEIVRCEHCRREIGTGHERPCPDYHPGDSADDHRADIRAKCRLALVGLEKVMRDRGMA